MAATETASRATAALDSLYRSHAGDVYRYAYALTGNRADAEDVTQATFVHALAALSRGEQPRKPANWLVVIAHNEVRQRARLRECRPVEVALDPDVLAFDEPRSDGPSADDLVQALQRIPASQREALVMRELEGRTYREIAETLGLSSSALESRLFRARRSLARELADSEPCDGVEAAMSKQLDGRLPRGEKKTLEQHLRACPGCRQLSETHAVRKKTFRSLAALAAPATMPALERAPSTTATLTPLGATGAVAAGTATGGAGVGSLTIGGLIAKTAAVVATASLAGTLTYATIAHRDESKPRVETRPATTTIRDSGGAAPPVERNPSRTAPAAVAPRTPERLSSRIPDETSHDPKDGGAPTVPVVSAGSSTDEGRAPDEGARPSRPARHLKPTQRPKKNGPVRRANAFGHRNSKPAGQAKGRALGAARAEGRQGEGPAPKAAAGQKESDSRGKASPPASEPVGLESQPVVGSGGAGQGSASDQSNAGGAAKK